MGERLRSFRVRAGLTQHQVAQRMGREYSSARGMVNRLEHGKIPDPRQSTITLYLQACGTKYSEFYDLLTQAKPVAPGTGPIAGSASSPREKRKLKRNIEKQVRSRPENAAYPLPVKQSLSTPDSTKERAEKFQSYRVKANLITLTVKTLLRDSPIRLCDYRGYQTLARHILGILKRYQGTKRQAKLNAEYAFVRKNRLNEKVAEAVKQLVIQEYQKLVTGRLMS
jgi:transcriptional regulator with XRE-family HTH domain